MATDRPHCVQCCKPPKVNTEIYCMHWTVHLGEGRETGLYSSGAHPVESASTRWMLWYTWRQQSFSNMATVGLQAWHYTYSCKSVYKIRVRRYTYSLTVCTELYIWGARQTYWVVQFRGPPCRISFITFAAVVHLTSAAIFQHGCCWSICLPLQIFLQVNVQYKWTRKAQTPQS